MRNDKKNKNILIRKITALSASFVFLLGIILTIVFICNRDTTHSKFMAYEGYYNSEQNVYNGNGKKADRFVKMSTLYNDSWAPVSNAAALINGKPIVIESNRDLYAFSILCNNNTDTFNTTSSKYVLLKDINWFDGNFGQNFEPVEDFKGEFDGSGYTIANLRFPTISDTSSYNGYFAMFLKNSGTIKNLGLIDPNIHISATASSTPSEAGIYYVSNLCGENNGTIQYVFVRDNLEIESKTVYLGSKEGIDALGTGYTISGVVSVNNNIFKDSYYASSRVFTGSVNQNAFQELLTKNNSTDANISNLYFYDALITNYTDTQVTYGGDLGRAYIYTDPKHYGTYCTSISELNTLVMSSDSGWYNPGKYTAKVSDTDTFESLVENIILTPIRIGFSNVTYDSTLKQYVITITSEEEYGYAYSLMKKNSNFASGLMCYKLSVDINLNDIAVPSYTGIFGATVTSSSIDAPKTIYISKFDYSINALGIKTYGAFPYLSGNISYINFDCSGADKSQITFNPTRLTGESENAIGFGVISGFVEGGSIDHCNVYINMTYDNVISKHYIGGIAGVLGGTGSITNSTANGSIEETNNSHPSFDEQTNKLDGVAIAGCVANVTSDTGTVKDLLSKVNITATGYNSKEVAIGGVIGAAYTIEAKNLQNRGEIKVGSNSSAANYSKIYVAGVIARYLGMNQQAKMFTNNGDIELYQSSNETYLAGVTNVDLQSTSNLRERNKVVFYGSGFTNGANVNIYNSNTNFMYTDVINLKSQNGFASKLSSLYNLNYKFDAPSTPLNEQTINVNQVQSFAPILNTDAASDTNKVDLTTVYNLRDIKLSMNGNVTSNLTYAGVTIGNYINYTDVRNEGNFTIKINNQLGTSSTSNNLYVNGIFNELTAGYKATNLYNGGKIDIQYTSTVYGNIFASGICYKNNNGFNDSQIELYNPSSDKYDKSLVGSINNAINNGEISVTNPNFSAITFSYKTIKSANAHLDTGSYYYASGSVNNNITTVDAASLFGTICTSGITIINESVITNTFNIGDIFAANYIMDQNKRNEINASGLVSYNIGKYAIIENSANDGDVKAINMSFYMNFDNGKSNIKDYTAKNAYVTSSGIVCHNDEFLNNNIPTVGSSQNSKQIIAFTINYGSIYSYNYYCNSTSSASEDFRSISAGVVGQGLLNLVNVMNYGNIYGSEIAGGVFGVVFFNTFASEISTSNKVNLANTINYSPVLVIDKGELELRNESTGTTYSHQTYTTFVGLSSTTTQYYYVDIPVYAKDYFNGSIFGIINFNGDTKAQNVDIRYLISFNEDVKLVGAEAQTPTVTVDVSKFYSAYIKFEGGYVLDTYIGHSVTYAPISSDVEVINHVSYPGVFNQNFPFYQAIKGNNSYLDIANHRTDIFISDYFEFVGATYVNPELLDKIGWGSIAYTAAADAFATDLAGVAKFIEYAKTNNNAQYTTLINEALNTDTWLSKCDNQVLIDVTNTLLANEEENTLLQMIDYIFSAGSTTYSMITSSTRTAILEAILAQDSTLDYSTLLDQIITYVGGYSNLLANSVLDSNDEAGNYLKNYISSLSNSAVEDILNTYCTYLKDASQNSYFTYSNSAQIRYDILSAIFENISSNTFYENLAEVLGIDTILNNFQRDSKAAMYEGYNNLIKENKIALYKAIIINNSSATSLARINTYITNMASEIDYFANIILKGYSKTSLENIYTDISVGEEASGSSTIDERVTLWNQIRVTDVFKSYLTSQLNDEGYSEGYIAKATEFRNTYQTNTLPRDTADDLDGDLSYTYTFNVTPSTYFLGPYKSTAKDYWKYHVEQVVPTNGDSADGADNSDKAIIDVMSKNEAEYLYNNGYTYGYQLFYYEYSDASSNNQLCAVQRTGEGTYAFAWRNGNNTDFTGGFINGTYDTLGNWSEAESIQVLDYDTNQYFDANGGGISKFTYISGDGDWTTETGVANVNGKWTITDANNKVHNVRGTLKDWADFILAHEIRHYIGYPTAKWHTTRMSGLFKYRSGVRWFTWKHNETTRRVHTSQYIDYNVDQLLQLDGYLTLYDDGTTKDSTEREIINDIFSDILNSNSNNFKKVIAAALLERSAYIDNDSYYKVEIPTINQNFTSYYNITATKATSIDTSKKYYNLVDGDYIEVDIKDINSSNYNSYYWITVSRGLIYDSTKTYYIRKNIDDYDYEYLDDYFINNIYSDTIVGNGNKAFDYLYQTNNTKTVKAYLTDGLSSDLKNKFISYCSTNQSAYSKLILELIKLNSIDISNFNFEFPVTIGNSTDLNAISIDNITSYNNLVCENKEVSIYNEDTDENYNLTHGYTFSQMVLSLTGSYQDLVILVGPKNTTGSFTYKIGNGNTRTQNVTENTIVTLTLNNNTSVTLNSTNQNVVIYGIFGHNTISYQYSDTMSFRYTLLDEENNATEKPGYYEWTLPTDNQIKTQIENRLDMYDIDYTDYTYTVATTIKSANFSSGSNDQIRYHRIVDVIRENNKVVIDTTTKKLGSNESFTYSVLLDNSYLGHKIRRQTSQDGTTWGEGNDKTKSGYYRFRLSYISMYITVNYNATGYNHIYTNFIDQDSIIDSVNRANNMSPENKAAKTFKNSTNYATKYPKFLVDAAHNLIPIDYSEVEYRSSLVSGLYYVNDGNSYSSTTGVYDNTKKYYTKNGNDYNGANINESTYIETIQSGKYYVSYQLANVPYNSNTIYYTKNGDIYTKLNSLSEQDFYNSVSITNSTYYVVTDNSDPDNLVYGLAGNTYDSNATYYTRSGEGTLDDPYVYTQANITIAQFYAGGTSNTYYVNGGTDYHLATRAFDNNLTYYTYDNGVYTVAGISSTEYYNSTISNVYYSNFELASGKFVSGITYYTRSGLGTELSPYVYTPVSLSSATYYSSCTSNKYYVLNGGSYVSATGDYNSSTDYYKLEDTEYVLYGTASKNIKGLLSLSYKHTSGTPEYCVPDLIAKLITSSNEAFKLFIDNVVSQSSNNVADYKTILQYLITNIGYYALNDAIKSSTSSITTMLKEKITAAFLVTDYKYILNNNANVYDSRLRHYIYYVLQNYQYINQNGTYDINKFYEFCEEIGYNLSTSGYGIYALSSNQGKLNGEFIPDNLVLSTMDTYYTIDSSTVKYKLVSAVEGIYTSSPTWRGGIASNADKKDVDGTVNYAFYVEMKQLIKSISTAVFEISLVNGSNEYYGDIDLEKKEITFYVSEYSSSLFDDYTVNELKLANNATAYDGPLSSYPTTENPAIPFEKNSTVTVNNINSTTHQFTVFAEDTTVHETYDIIFKILSTHLDMYYNDTDHTKTRTRESSDKDDTIELVITSSEAKLPQGFNLKPYLSFILMDEETETSTIYKMNTEYITISSSSIDHVIDANGNAIATIVVSHSLPQGTYKIKLSICGAEASVEYIKEAAQYCDITEIKFNNNDVVFDEQLKATSQILLGRAYNNIELTDYSGIYSEYYDFYLDVLKVSSNASVAISATHTQDADSGLWKYVVTIRVTAENGTDYKEYVHTLVENNPYLDGSDYATAYKDGSTLTNGTILSDSNVVSTTYSMSDNIYTPEKNAANHANVRFARGIEPTYRLNYDLARFYKIGDITYKEEDITEDERIYKKAGLVKTFNSLNVSLSDACETGIYKFKYTYDSKGVWASDLSNVTFSNGKLVGEEYHSTYEFPILIIEKVFSIDATLHNITFNDSYRAFSNASTGMEVDPMRPVGENIANDEIFYETNLKDGTNQYKKIAITESGINYKNLNQDMSVTSIYDYYIVGSVSNAQLSNYAPTFVIENHAMIFQYVTTKILNEYGKGKQNGASDRSILGNHDPVTYLYIPCISGTDRENFLVVLDITSKKLTTVYTVDQALNISSTGQTLKTEDNKDVTLSNIQITKSQFTYGGKTYEVIKDEVGKPTNNSSLYMDYIGNPEENHFWYVSYVVFSESYIRSSNNANVKYYHIALIDTSNNVYFEVKIIVPNSFDVTNKFSTVYLSIVGYHYQKDSTDPTRVEVGCYGINPTLNTTTNNYEYTLRYSVQILPSAYYYFYIDLPGGYKAQATITNPAKASVRKASGTPDYQGHGADYDGAYLPPSSIVAQRVPVTINVTADSSEETNNWAITSTDVYTRKASLDNDSIVGN